MEIIKVGVFHFDIFSSYGTSIRLSPSPSGRHHACQSVLEVKCSGKFLCGVYLPQCIDLCRHRSPLNALPTVAVGRKMETFSTRWVQIAEDDRYQRRCDTPRRIPASTRRNNILHRCKSSPSETCGRLSVISGEVFPHRRRFREVATANPKTGTSSASVGRSLRGPQPGSLLDW